LYRLSRLVIEKGLGAGGEVVGKGGGVGGDGLNHLLAFDAKSREREKKEQYSSLRQGSFRKKGPPLEASREKGRVKGKKGPDITRKWT